MVPPRRQTFLYLSTLISVWSVLADHKLYGLHSDELRAGHLILPRRVDGEGEFLSYNLTHQHDQHYDEQPPYAVPPHPHPHPQRSKRQATQEQQDQLLHLQLDINDETLHLEMRPHSYFMTPHLIVERHRRDLRTRTRPVRNTNCHFHGRIRGHNESRVALSTCRGLVGHIKTNHNEYYIEPSKYHDAHPTHGHPHVVFHRSAVREKAANNKTKLKRKQRKRKHQKRQHNHQHQHHHHHHHHHHHNNHRNHNNHHQHQDGGGSALTAIPPPGTGAGAAGAGAGAGAGATAMSNCGTKEPRRRIETRLEWQRQGKVRVQGGRKIRRHQRHQPAKYKYRTTLNDVASPPPPPPQPQPAQAPPSSPETKVNGNNNNKKNNIDKSNTYATPISINQRNSMKLTSLPSPSSLASASSLAKPTTAAVVDGDSDGDGDGDGDGDDDDDSDGDVDGDIDGDGNMDGDVDGDGDGDGDGLAPLHTLPHRMKKRSISSPRHVETLIVADTTMVAFHNDVVTYLLTIMNMVSALYKDPSIGNSIEIVVVKIILLEDTAAHPDLNLTQNAQRNLDTFCSWQHKSNTASERDPHHHDVAILITRKNICGNNCMTLGLANVGGMCKPKQSCSVNEDNGIMLSHTIAHELGHNFGMFHDTAKIGCHPRVGSIVHIMTPTFGADTLQVCWSNCSRKYITHFLDQGLGDCLDDAPAVKNKYNYSEVLPGVLYNAELQCRLQFNITDSDVGACSSMNEICSTLWCKVNGECVTNMRPTAPGTSCGKRKWCQNGKCVRMAEITPVDGGWGDWSAWSECSRSCGGGVSIQQRECNNPLPANGGLFCIGERKRYKICKQQPCPPGEPSFRATQCSKYDNVPYQGAKYKWLPFFDKKNPCKLYCTDVDDTIIANWGDVVLNGTPCTLGTNNMCIDGICKKVGCDWLVDSDLQEDRCGICGGAGDQCKPVKEVFRETLNVTDGYVEIFTIPARARNIVVRELDHSANFLGVAPANSGKFYLNGDSLISMPGEFVVAGAESLYERVDDRETITIPQPIEHSIALYMIVRSRDPYKGIYYEFTLPALGGVNGTRHYVWKLGDWTGCTSTCGGGVQYREPLCYDNGKLTTDELLCWAHAANARPKRRLRICNDLECPAHWLVGPWQFCPVTCRQSGAPQPLRRRSVMCLGHNEIVVDEANCSPATRPTDTEPCDQQLPGCKAAAQLPSIRLQVRHL